MKRANNLWKIFLQEFFGPRLSHRNGSNFVGNVTSLDENHLQRSQILFGFGIEIGGPGFELFEDFSMFGHIGGQNENCYVLHELILISVSNATFFSFTLCTSFIWALLSPSKMFVSGLDRISMHLAQWWFSRGETSLYLTANSDLALIWYLHSIR